MLKKKMETYNDGILTIYETVKNRIMKEKASRRFSEKTMGISRFFQAKVAGDKIDRVVSIPKGIDISSSDVIKISGKQYQIVMIQRKPEEPNSLTLTLKSAPITKKVEYGEGN